MKYYETIEELEKTFNSKFEMTDLTDLDIGLGRCTKYSINKDLQINGLNISKFSIEEIPWTILDMQGLEHLILSDNHIIDISGLKNLQNLIRLVLSRNRIAEITGLGALKKLKYLDLKKNMVKNIKPVNELTNLLELNLSYNQIDDISPLRSLVKLERIDLRNNRISEISELGNLKRLKELNLNMNQVSTIEALKNHFNKSKFNCDFGNNPLDKASISFIYNTKPYIIKQLEKKLYIDFKKVETIDTKKLIWEKKAEYSINHNGSIDGLGIFNHNLPEIPQEIFQIENIKILVLQGNKISSINNIESLSQLEQIDLEKNQISDISPLGKINNLKVLDLANNKIVDISPIKNSKNIIELHLKNNQIIDINPLKDLICYKNINSIYLQGNQIEDISVLKLFNKIIHLDLSHNQIRDISILKFLLKLEWLSLESNKIEDISSLRNLEKLKFLNLNSNLIEKLPAWITELNLKIRWEDDKNKTGISLFNNPVNIPPVEIVKQGNEAILNYFEQLGREKEQYLFETKLLIIGEAGTGKTSFALKMKDENALLPEISETTLGIEVTKWSFEINHALRGKQTMYANLWDFGGQKIYQGTHQVFFTPKSLYVLLDDTREEKTDFAYWLNTIEQLAGEQSKLQIILNKKFKHLPKVDENGLKSRFGQLICGFSTIDLKNEIAEIINLQSEIKYHLQRLHGIGDPLPSSWVNIRKELFEIQANYISYDKFVEICKRNKIDLSKLDFLSEYFNRIGVFTHYYDDKLLKQRLFLNSDWLVKRVYEIIDHQIVKENNGRISFEQIIEIWKDKDFMNEIDYFICLMNRFGLMYEIQRNKTFVVPAHLPDKQPYESWKFEKNKEVLQFAYEFDKYMPRGLMHRLIVTLNQYITDHNYVWNRGMNIAYNNSFAEIKETYDKNNKFLIRIFGNQRKELLGIIIHEFEKLLNPYTKLNYEKLIPCICNQCKDNLDPYFFKYSSLEKRKEVKKYTIECDISYELVSVLELLDGIEKNNAEDTSQMYMAYIEKLIIQNKIKAAIDELLNATSQNRQNDLHNKLIILANRFTLNENEKMQGKINHDTYTQENTELTSVLISCLHEYGNEV